jgi:hypothetical protein
MIKKPNHGTTIPFIFGKNEIQKKKKKIEKPENAWHGRNSLSNECTI